MNHVVRKCERLIHSLLWLAAILLILSALCVASLRAALPHLNVFRQDIIELMESRSEIQLEIGDITGRWHRFDLFLDLEDVRAKGAGENARAAEIGDVHLKLDVWRTLSRFEPHFSHIALSNTRLNLPSPFAGRHHKSSDKSIDATRRAVLSALLENFEQFSIADSLLEFGPPHAPLISLHLDKLTWHNDGERHQGRGQLYLDDLEQQRFDIVIDLNGDGSQPETLAGEMYVEASDLDLHALHNRTWPQLMPLSDSQLNLAAWIDFDLSQLHDLTLAIQPSYVQWPVAEQVHTAHFLPGVVQVKRQQQGWQIQTHDLALQLGNGVTQPLVMQAAVDSLSDYRLQMGAIELDAIVYLSDLWLASAESAHVLHQLQPQGQLGPVQIQHSAQAGWRIKGKLQQLSWQPAAGVPGFAHVSGLVSADNSGADIVLQMPAQTIQVGDQFFRDIPLHSGEVQLRAEQLAAGGWQLHSEKLKLETEHLKFAADFKLQAPKGQDASLFLYGEAQLSDLQHADNYFPLKAMGSNTSNYLARSLHRGDVELAQILWHGPLAQFPYQGHDGIFQAYVPLRNAEFQFQPDWQSLTQLSLDLLFENSGLWMQGESARLGEVAVSQLRAQMPRLNKPDLTIQAQVTGEGAAVADVLIQSPLQNSVGKPTAAFDIQGQVVGQLDLDIPLSVHPVAVVASGSVRFDGNSINIPELNQRLDQLQGELLFHNDQLKINDMQAQWNQLPLSIELQAEQTEQDYQVHVSAHQQWLVSALPELWQSYLAQRLSGQLDWQLGVDVSLSESGNTVNAAVYSDTVGVRSELPQPYAKASDTAKPLVVQLHHDGEQLTSNLMWGDTLHGYFAQSEAQPLNYWIGLGKLTRPQWATDRRLYVKLAQADLNDWEDFLKQWPKGSASDTQQKNTNEAKSIGLQYGSFALAQATYGQLQFDDASAEVTWQGDNLIADVRSKQFAGEVAYTKQATVPRVTVQADYLVLPWEHFKREEHDTWQKPETRQPKAHPEIDFNCSRCELTPYRLGRVHFSSRHRPGKGVEFKNAVVQTEHGRLEIESGSWFERNGQDQTQLQGKFIANDLEKFWRDLLKDADPLVKRSDTRLDWKVSWPGAPHDFSMSELSGTASVKVGEGYIPDINDRGARVLAVLSVESLLRKLKLDFADIADKGLFYSSVQSELSFENGVMHVDEMDVDGVAGDLSLEGTLDWNTEELDYRVNFYPALTDSLPVLAGLTITPVVGLYVFAISKVLTPVVEVVTQVNFAVTGTLDQPVIEELDRRREKIEVPADFQQDYHRHLGEPLMSPVPHTPGVIDPQPQANPEPSTSIQ